MRIPRFYLPADLTAGQTLSLDKDQAHYALTVLRLKHDRPVEVFDGRGTCAQATLLHTSRRTADVVIESTASPATESPLETVLLQGISKGDRMDYSIQKAVELGVTRIQPLFTEHCDVKLSGDKLDKKRRQWQDIAINACEQSNRNVVPEITQPETYQAWLKAANAPSGLVLSPTAEHSLTTLNPSLAESPIHLLIGPEGGLTDDEVDLAVAAGLTAIQLGPRILRTETAAPVILAALQTLWGDFNTPMTAS